MPTLSDIVSGKLLDAAGVPVSGAAVEIAGKVVTTNSSGAFEVKGVLASYDAVIVAEAQGEVTVYEGLTTRTPALRLVIATGMARTATIRGTLSGGPGFPLPGEHRAALLIDGARPAVEPEVTDASYSMSDVAWYGAESRTFTVGALSWAVDASGLPKSYDGYGEKSVTVNDGGTVGMLDGSTPETNIELSPIGSRRVTGNVSVPSGCTPELSIGPSNMNIISDVTPAGAFSYVLPTLPKRLVYITLSCAFSGGGYSYIDMAIGAESSVAVDGVPTPQLSLPVDGASYVRSDTPFAWSTEQTQYSVVQFEYGDWSIFHFGTKLSTSFPDLSRFGIPFPAEETVTWRVYALGRRPAVNGTTDDALDDSPLAEDESSSWAVSPTRTFVTAPPPTDDR